MKNFFSIHFALVWFVYIVLDVVCIGLGMGVPIFCILLGFPTGWYIARRYYCSDNKNKIIEKSFLPAVITTSVTLLFMVIIWGPSGMMIFDSQADFINYGHPYFLYDPYISFIGWIILMVMISPFLQLLTTIFSSYVTIMWMLR